MSDPHDVALQVVAALDRAGFTCAIGGGLAFGRWVRPRATLDVDLNIFVDEEEYDAALDALAASGATFDRKECIDRFRRGDVAFARLDGVRIDIFVPSIPFYAEAERAIVVSEIDGQSVPYPSAVVLAVFKLLFFRPKDIADLQKLVTDLDGVLDTTWVRQHVAEMMGEDDERIRRWDEIVAHA